MQLDDHYLVSARIRRQYLGLTADHMAHRLGIKRTSYLRFERGERRVYLDHAFAIAKELDCKVDDLARMPSPDEVRQLYVASQQNKITPIDDETGELIPAPQDNTSEIDNLINKTEGAKPEHPGDHDIVVDAHATPNATNAADNQDLAAALAGWDDSE